MQRNKQPESQSIKHPAVTHELHTFQARDRMLYDMADSCNGGNCAEDGMQKEGSSRAIMRNRLQRRLVSSATEGCEIKEEHGNCT